MWSEDLPKIPHIETSASKNQRLEIALNKLRERGIDEFAVAETN